MSTHQQISVPDTAFVTASFRARHEALSGDPYARLWCNPGTDAWIEDYLEKVSAEEPLTHSLRNRFFLDHMQKLYESNQLDVVVNFGCGFSMYPFLLPPDVLSIDIDMPEIVDHKKVRVDAWQAEGHLPQRNITYLGVDFSQDFRNDLTQVLQPMVSGKRSFIILEGVLFFLTLAEAQNLFALFRALQAPGDHVACCSFQPGLKRAPAYRRLLNFFASTMAGSGSDNFLMLEDDFYQNQPGYTVVDIQDYFTLSAKHHHQPSSSKDDILNETCYLMQRNVEG